MKGGDCKGKRERRDEGVRHEAALKVSDGSCTVPEGQAGAMLEHVLVNRGLTPWECHVEVDAGTDQGVVVDGSAQFQSAKFRLPTRTPGLLRTKDGPAQTVRVGLEYDSSTRTLAASAASVVVRSPVTVGSVVGADAGEFEVQFDVRPGK